MGKAEPRSVTPLLRTLRNFLLGRRHTNPLRYGDYYAPRTQPPPNLPAGSANKLNNNYYCSRDGRREAKPPILISAGLKQIGAKSEISAQTRSKGAPLPGNVCLWDKH